jgi:hypothetical protein
MESTLAGSAAMKRTPQLRQCPNQVVAAGEDAPPKLKVGDFILCHRKGFISWLIRTFTRSHWSHAALVISEEGLLQEALTRGVVRTPIEAYRDIEYTLVRTFCLAVDQIEIRSFADYTLGERYGKLTIACVAMAILTHWHMTIGFQGQAICSGLVARALERAGWWFGVLAEDVSPARLAQVAGVEPAANH